MLSEEDIKSLFEKLKKLEQDGRYLDLIYKIDQAIDCNPDMYTNYGFLYSMYILAGEIALYKLKDMDIAMPYLMRCYSDCERIEGLIHLVQFYFDNKRYLLALSLCLVCLKTNEIPDIGCSEIVYRYTRYLLHAQICQAIGLYQDGIDSAKECLKYIKPEHLSEEEFEKLRTPVREVFESCSKKMVDKE